MKLFTLYRCRYCIALILLIISFQSFGQKTWDGGAGTNLWNDGNNWNPNGVPTAAQTVTIGNGYTVVLNTTTTIASLTIGGGASGSLTLGNNNTDRDLIVTGNVIINNGATLLTAGNGGNTLEVGGNLTNNGTFNMNPAGNATCDVIFDGAANQTVSGTGATTNFNYITVSNTGAVNNNIVEIMPGSFTTVASFLTLTQGIIKMSGSYTLANTFFTPGTVGGYPTITINADEGIWLNNANVSVTAQGSDARLYGSIRVTAGTFNIGTGSDWWLYYSNGAAVTVEGGAINVAGSFNANTDAAVDALTYTQSGGVFTTNIYGNSGAFGMVHSFGIPATTSVFTMSGGSIVIQNVRGNANTADDFSNLAATSTVTGGTIQIGNASTATPAINFRVSSTPAIYDFLINNTNAPVAEIRTNTTVLNDVTISTGGTLDVTTNNYSLAVGRNFSNSGTFTPRSGTVTFNGGGLQTIAGTTATTFYNLTANNTTGNTTTGITLSRPATVTNVLALTNGHITTSNPNFLIMSATSSVNGANYGVNPKLTSGGSTSSFVNGPMRKIGNTNFLFPVGKISTGTATNYGHHPAGISAPTNVTDAFTVEYIRGSASALGTVNVAGLDHVSNCEYWNIERTTGASNVNVSLSWNTSSSCNTAAYVNNLGSLRASHFNGSNWDNFGGGSDLTSTVMNGSVTWTGVTAFSPFSIGSTSAAFNPLPVKLVNVKAYKSAASNKVEWTNLTEMEVVKYEVERSVNGSKYETMTSVAARSNSNDRQDYSVYDLQPASLTYYRIKVTSIDGEVLYSPVVKVSSGINATAELNLYPNPVTGKQLTLYVNNTKAGSYTVRIYAANGQVVKTEAIKHPGGSYSKTIELPGQLQAGQYFLQATDSEGQLSTLKFIMQ